MSDTYSQCPQCNYKPAAPLPISEPCPVCGIYTFKWGQHLSVPSVEPMTGSPVGMRDVGPVFRIKIGVMLASLGAFSSVQSLASGTVFIGQNGDVLSRANAPILFWFVVLSAVALAVFGTSLAVVALIKERTDGDVAALGITRGKAVQYLGLFCVLVVIYSVYLRGIIAGPLAVELVSLGWLLAKFCLISALPFAVLACFDAPWRSSDAAPVSVIAWSAVFGAFFLKHPNACPSAVFLLFVPLVLSALLGHTVGALLGHTGGALCHQGNP